MATFLREFGAVILLARPIGPAPCKGIVRVLAQILAPYIVNRAVFAGLPPPARGGLSIEEPT